MNCVRHTAVLTAQLAVVHISADFDSEQDLAATAFDIILTADIQTISTSVAAAWLAVSQLLKLRLIKLLARLFEA